MMLWEDVHFPIPDGNGGMILPLATTVGTQLVSYDVTWRDDILNGNDHFYNVEEGMSRMNRQRYNCVPTRLCDMLEDVVVTRRTDGWTCPIGVCSYVLEMLDVVNLARN